MTLSGPTIYFLPSGDLGILLDSRFAKLTPNLTRLDDEATPVTLLDNFDQSLRRSHRVLLRVGDTVELLLPDGCALTQPVRRKDRFVNDFPEGPVRLALADMPALRALLPVGAGSMRRGVLTLMDDERKTQARGYLRIIADTEGEPAILVTLQGLRGYDKAMGVLRRHIEACGGIPLERGGLYQHLFPQHVPYEAKPDVAVARDEAAFAAASDIIETYLIVARANEAGVIADHDSEFLHDYRIALRKVRSVLSLFKGVYKSGQTDALKARFSALMGPTGRLRDLDVYLLERQRYYDLLPDCLHDGLDQMFQMFALERKSERTRLARHLRSAEYEREMMALTKLFASRKKLKPGPNADIGAHDYACLLIWKRYRKICRIAQGIGADTDEAEVHKLRIHCKKLRYLMEFFGAVFPRAPFKALLKPLKRLQDNLGRFNDYAVQQVSLQRILQGLDAKGGPEPLRVAQSVGALIAVLHSQQAAERARVVESFARFNSAETQQMFRDLFQKQRNKK